MPANLLVDARSAAWGARRTGPVADRLDGDARVEEAGERVARIGSSDQRAAGRQNGGRRSGMRDTGAQAAELALAYIRQETVEPVRGLGRFMVFGIAGSLSIALGSVFLLVALLRLLQTETGAFHGNLSWVPYLIVIVLAAGVIALSAWRITAGPARRRRPAQPTEGE